MMRTRTRTGMRLCLFLVAALGLSACSGARQLIYVHTGDAQTDQEVGGARCVISDGRNRQWVVEKTPGKAVIERGGGVITVVCQRRGFQDSIVRVDPALSIVTLGNAALLTGAGGGFFAGTGVATGLLSGQALGYPRRLNVAMAAGDGRNSVPKPATQANLREQAKRLSVGRSCLDQIGPYDDYIAPLGDGSELCR